MVAVLDMDENELDLDTVKADLFWVLDQNPNEVDAVIEALQQGKIDGQLYAGDCTCLIGTIAKAKGVNHRDVPGYLFPYGNGDLFRPCEHLFILITVGETPDNNGAAKLAYDWIMEWKALNG